MSIYPSGTLIANRYEVVQGPREKSSLAGGMGLVYLCVDHAENGRPVALKTFRPELLPDRAARDRFLREGTTWVQLGKHPHIVRCYQVFRADFGTEVFFVLELVAAAEGKRDASLRSWLIPGKPLPVEQALFFALHIARGMKHATTKIPGLVHRDLKPENVLVGRDGFARVTDFGLVGILSDLSEAVPEQVQADQSLTHRRLLTFTKGFVGTPEYAAPEQFDGRELDERSDIYACGCILYEMLIGQAPFTKNYKTQQERFLRYKECHTSEEPKPPRAVVPTVTDEIENIVLRCLRKKSEERFGNWPEVEAVVKSAYRAMTGKEAPSEITTEGETRTERVAMGWSYNTMGISYADIGKFSVARDYFDKVLAIGLQEGERSFQSAALGNLGEAYRQLGDARGAIGYFKQALAIMRELGDRDGEGGALGNLGIAYRELGDARGAIGYFEQHLALAREIGDRRGEAAALGNLGTAYCQLGDARGAIRYYKQDLALARKIGDRRGEAAALGNLGIAYAQLGDVRGAIGYFEQCLNIAREIGDRRGEGQTLGNLGNAYFQLGDARSAIGYYEQYLAIAREIGDRHGEAAALGNLGNAYFQLGDARGAIGYYERHLAIARELGDRCGEAAALGNLGNAYRQLGDARRAIDLHEQSLVIKQKISDRIGAAETSFNLAFVLAQQGRLREAETHAKQAAQIFTQVGNSEYAASTQELLDEILSQDM